MQLLGATAGRFWMPHASVASLTSSTTFEIISCMVKALVQQSESGPIRAAFLNASTAHSSLLASSSII